MPLLTGAEESINAPDSRLPIGSEDGSLQLTIDRRVEMGKLAEMFLGTIGKYLFYIVIIVCFVITPNRSFFIKKITT